MKGKVTLMFPTGRGKQSCVDFFHGCLICVDFTASEYCGVVLPIVSFSRFTLQCSCFTYDLKKDSAYWKYLPLSEVLTNTTFNVTVPAKQPGNAGLCPSPFPLPGHLVVILAPREKRSYILTFSRLHHCKLHVEPEDHSPYVVPCHANQTLWHEDMA